MSLLCELHKLLARHEALRERQVDVSITDLVPRTVHRSSAKAALAEARAAMLAEMWNGDVVVEKDTLCGGRVLTIRYTLPRHQARSCEYSLEL